MRRILASVMALGAVLAPSAAFAASSDDDVAAMLFLGIIIAVFILIYFIPSIVAFRREHPNRWVILLLNFVFGSTVIGWVGCLIWALQAIHISQKGSNGGESGLNLFVNDPRPVYLVDHNGAPAAPQQPSVDHCARQLERIKGLLDSGVIDQAEYEKLREPILKRMVS